METMATMVMGTIEMEITIIVEEIEITKLTTMVVDHV